jgi:hypothetical protein
MNATIDNQVKFAQDGKHYSGTVRAISPRYLYIEVQVQPKGTPHRYAQTDELGSTILIEKKQVTEILKS